MQKKYKVSVIIPCYNGARYLKRAVNNLLAQTLRELEIIIVNDGSKDDSLAIAKALQREHDNIQIVDKVNQGLLLARRSGVGVASGEYIGFLDVDDLTEPIMFGTMYEAAVKNSCDLVISNYISDVGPFRIRTRFPADPGFYNHERIKAEILGGLLFDSRSGSPVISSAVWIKLIRAELLKKTFLDLDFPVQMSEDHVLTLAMFRYVCSCMILDDYLYHYIFHRHSMMTVYKPGLTDTFLYMHETIYPMLAEDLPEIRGQIEGHLCMDMCFALRNLAKLRASYKEHLKLVTDLFQNERVRGCMKDEYLKNLPATSRRAGRLFMNGKLKRLAFKNFLSGAFNLIH